MNSEAIARALDKNNARQEELLEALEDRTSAIREYEEEITSLEAEVRELKQSLNKLLDAPPLTAEEREAALAEMDALRDEARRFRGFLQASWPMPA